MPDQSVSKATHRVRIHVRSIATTQIPFSTILTSTQAVYRTYGIAIELASSQSMQMSAQEFSTYRRVDGVCDWVIERGELYDLQRRVGWFRQREPFVFLVDALGNGNLGCGGHIPGQPACIVTARAPKWATAHELGHVLLGGAFGPVHSPDAKNLMSTVVSTNPNLPLLDEKQVDQIKRSPWCMQIAVNAAGAIGSAARASRANAGGW